MSEMLQYFILIEATTKIQFKKIQKILYKYFKQKSMLVRQLEVEEVIGKANFDSMIFYLIKWKHKEVKESSWKHQHLLSNIKQKIAIFNKEYKDFELPIISQKYQQALDHKMYELSQEQHIEAKNINKQKTQKKAKVSKNIYYLVKWENYSVSASTWESSFKLQNITKKVTKFNKQNQNQDLPYIDTFVLTYLHEVEKIDNEEMEQKKQQLKNNKQRKNNENDLNLLTDQFMRKLRRLKKIFDKQQKIRVMTKYRESKQRKNKQMRSKEFQFVQKQSQSSNQQEQQQVQNSQSEKDEQKEVQQQKYIKQQIQEQGQLQLIQLQKNDKVVDFFKQQQSGEIMDYIAQRIQVNQSQSQVLFQKINKEKPKDTHEKVYICGPKIQEPFSEDSFSSQFKQTNQKLHFNKTFHKTKQAPKNIKPKQLQKVEKDQQNRQKVKSKKIVSVKFQFKVDSITKKYRKQNLYRVQYQDGDVRYWTTSQLHKELSSPIEWIQYLQHNAKWEK